MPPRKPKITLRRLEIVQRLKNAVQDADRLCVTHRLRIDIEDGSPPRMFTVDVTREAGGRFVATCWELPLVLVTALTEENALTKAEQDIKLLLGETVVGHSSMANTNSPPDQSDAVVTPAYICEVRVSVGRRTVTHRAMA